MSRRPHVSAGWVNLRFRRLAQFVARHGWAGLLVRCYVEARDWLLWRRPES